MAATAGGVAVGSVVGHGMSNMLFGGGGSSSSEPAAAQAAPAQPAPQQQYYDYQQPPQQQEACAWEVKQFVQCAQSQGDLTLCEGFNQALKDCKNRMAMYN